MPERQHKTRGNFQGKYKSSCDDQNGKETCGGEFYENLHKVVCSWLNFKQYLYSDSNIEMETLRNVLPHLFQFRQYNVTNKHNVTETHRDRKKSLYVIDLDKLNTNLSLSKDEKKTLKKILSRLKYRKEDMKRCNKETKKSVAYKLCNVFSKERKENKGKSSHSKTKQNKKRLTKSKRLSATAVCSECQREKIVTKAKKKTQNNFKKPITLSQEKILKSLIDFDPMMEVAKPSIQGCGSSCSISGLFGETQSININNIEFKYLNPTYLVQYNSNDIEEPKGRDRLFSNFALGAHLGRGRMTIHEPRDNVPHHLDMTMHYEESGESHLVGLGPVTEKMIKERQSLRHPDRISSASEPVIRYPRFPLERNFPFDERDGSVDEGTTQYGRNAYYTQANPRITLKRSLSSAGKPSMCNRIKRFLKKCLCMTNGERYKPGTKEANVPLSRLDKNLSFEQRYNLTRSFTRTRTTEDEFFNGPNAEKRVTFHM